MEDRQIKQQRFPNRTAMIAWFLRGSGRYFAWSMFFSAIVALADLIVPKIIQYTADDLIGDGEASVPGIVLDLVRRAGGAEQLRNHLWYIALAVALVALIGGICRYLMMLLNSAGSEHLVKRMRDTLYGHILRLPYSWHGSHHTGDMIQRCTSDVETIKVFVSEQLTSLVRVVLLIGLSLAFMADISAPLALVESAFIPVIVISSVVFYTKAGRTFEKVDQQEGRLSSIAQENLTGVRVVRAFGKEAFERTRFERQNETYTHLWYRLMRVLASFWVTGNVVATLRNLVVILAGAYFVIQGRMTTGGLIAFISYNALISLPVRSLGRVITEMSKAGISIDRLREIMNAEEEEGMEPAEEAPALSGLLSGEIVFDHVTFSFPDESSGREVLRDVSFRVEGGKTIGILGATGSGKSTILALLDRLYDVPEGCGEIRIGGRDIREFPLHTLRRGIGLVLQEPYLFSGTLADAISIASEDAHDAREKKNADAGESAANKEERLAEEERAGRQEENAATDKSAANKEENTGEYAAPQEEAGSGMKRVRSDSAPLEQVRYAARIADLDETAMRFPHRYETFVGERGVTLSGGQRQRAAIAQMVLRRTPIVAFDDSLSAVDAKTDQHIRDAIRRELAGSTVLIVAHRITSLMDADEIIVLSHGRIVQRGTHEELLKEDGIYRQTFELQTQEGV